MIRPSKSDISQATQRLTGLVRQTPCMTVDGADFGFDGLVSLKLEFTQHSGTFKARGVSNFMATNTVGSAGVTAASGGNHGAAVAWAAQAAGVPARIFVPTISSPAKVERLRSYGADVVQTGDVYADALAACNEFLETSDATGIHAYNDPSVVSGAGTVGVELEQQVDPLDAVFVSCGGGGLVAGVATWFSEGGSGPTVVACETEGTASYAKAKAAGEPVDVEVSGIAADALGAPQIGELAFEALTAAGAESAVVTDADVVDALDFLWQRFRFAVEPSTAVAVAAVRSGAWTPRPNVKHIGIVLCGANTPYEPPTQL